MLKVQVNDLVKILTVDEVGECKDGRTFVRCSALSFFDEDETYMVLTAFGPVADMIADNHTGENMRRAFVSGHLQISKGKAKQKVRVDGAVKTIMVPDYQFQILADSVRFIDKNRAGETEVEIDEEDVVDYDVVDDEVQETAATSGDVNIVDADDEEPVSTNRRTARNNSYNRSRTRNQRNVKRVVPE